jgi:predicted ATPase/transcriptional regulator with XRE-family HTH domain
MDASASPPFGALLRRYRLAAGLSQETLAERAGLSVQAIGALERGDRRAPYRETVELLAGALGLSDAERAQLQAAVARRRGPATTAPTRPDQTMTNLPVSITSFVGREQEQAVVLRLLASSRFLTLTGIGGIGKTRLAIQVAALVSARYTDGVRLVDLAAVTDPMLVPQAIAQVAGVQELADVSLVDRLTDMLRAKELLLLLDNCEHVRATVGPFATTLLRACPRLRILATSREALGVIGETVWWVPSMPAPGSRPEHLEPPSIPLGVQFPNRTTTIGTPATGLTAASVEHVESVQLFCERATAVQADFALTDVNAAAVGEICRRLDGIPLAIELAAAWTSVLSPDQIAARLEDRFRLLTGSAGAPARHQTLRASLDWSYELLSEPERRLMQRLAVFIGGCTLAAAEGVSVDTAPEALLDLLAQLVQKSLVVVERNDPVPRYRLLETVRQYIVDRSPVDDEIAVRDAHLRWYVLLAERAERPLFRGGRAQWLQDLGAEHANIRAALEWTVSAPRPELGMRLVGALHGYWWHGAHLSEGRQWAQRLLALPSDNHRTAARANTLSVAAIYGWVKGSQGNALSDVEASVAIWRDIGDQHGLAFSLMQLAVTHPDPAVMHSSFAESREIFTALEDTESIALSLYLEGYVNYRTLGDVTSATELIREARRLFRAQNDLLHFGSCAYMLGEIAFYQGAAEQARSLFSESLSLFRVAGDKRQTALALAYLGRIADHLGDTDGALALLEESQALRYERGDPRAISEGLAIQALILMRHGRLQRSATLLAESLALERSQNNLSGIARVLDSIAVLTTAQGQPQRAALILGAVQALREVTGDAITPTWRALYDRTVADVRAALGEDTFAAALATGRSLSLEEAIGEALEQVTTID